METELLNNITNLVNTNVLNQLQSFDKSQAENIAKTLSSKYGKGSINLDSGTFTPTE